MPKEDKITLDAEVTEALPDAMFKVRLQNDQQIIAYVSGKMRKFSSASCLAIASPLR